MYDLAFDSLTHTYTLDGRTVPGITEILRTVGVISPFLNKEAMQRGSYIHEAIELHLDGKLHPESAEKYRGWLNAVDTCLADNDWTVIETELPVADLKWRYATKIDALVEPSTRGRVKILNWKSGNSLPWYGLQSTAEMMAVFCFLCEVGFSVSYDHYTVYISEDGTYDMGPPSQIDPCWENVMGVYDWIQRHSSSSVRPRSHPNMEELVVFQDMDADIFNNVKVDDILKGTQDDKENCNSGDEKPRGIFG